MDTLPLWVVLLGTVAGVLAVSELGFITGRKRAQQAEFEGEAQVSALTAAHLGLLAFILAFSFSLAAAHADKRKALVLDEAIAIENLYLKASLINSPQGKEIQQALREYTRLRATVGDTDDIPLFIKRSEEILERLWREIRLLSTISPFDELDSLVVQSAGEVIALHERRVTAGVRSRIPFVIWISLYIILALSMLGMGYFSGIKGRRSPLAHTALSISFSIVLVLIADLDRPREGLVKPDHSLMKQLSQRLEKPPTDNIN